jgi:hypothetical protein
MLAIYFVLCLVLRLRKARNDGQKGGAEKYMGVTRTTWVAPFTKGVYPSSGVRLPIATCTH